MRGGHLAARAIGAALSVALLMAGDPLPARAAETPVAPRPAGAVEAPALAASASTAANTVYLPNITRMLGGPDGWQTPFIVQNVGGAATDLTMSFYAQSDGRLVKTRVVTGLAPGRSVFHDPNADPELPAGGQFSVVVASSVTSIVAVVNEHQNVRDPARQEALSYTGLSSGSTVVSLPYVVKGVGGWLTTMIIQNLGTAPTVVTARFLTGATSTVLTRSIGPGRSGVIDPSVEGAITPGTYSVTLTADRPIAAVVNAHNDAAGVPHPMGFSYNGIPADSSSHTFVPYVADLPALARRSALYVQNDGLAPEAPTLTFRVLGLDVSTELDLPAIPPGTAIAVVPSLTKVGAGEFSVEVTGGQFAVVAATTTSTSATGYTGVSEPAERIYLPNVTRTLGGPSGWTTPIALQTASPYQSAITLRWYGFADGALAYTQTISDLAYGATRRVDPLEIPALADNSQYAVVVDAPFGATAVVMEQNRSGGDGEMSYEGTPAPAGVSASPCVPFSGPAGTTFTCSFAGLPAGSAATSAVSTSYSEGVATAEGATAADGTLTVRHAVQAVGAHTLTVHAGGVTRTAQFNVMPGSFSVAITDFTDRSLTIHSDTALPCVPTIALADGSVRSGGDLFVQSTGASGDATWYYAQLTGPPGPATAHVSCAWSDLAIADERPLFFGTGFYGHVSDQGGGPVVGAAIRIFQGLTRIESLPPVSTDAFGNYAFAISPAAYRVQAVPPVGSGISSGFAKDALGFATAPEYTVLSAGVAANVSLSSGFLVTGKVVDTLGISQSGRNVYVSWRGAYVVSLLTGSDGEFAFRVPAGDYVVRIYPAGPCCSGSASIVSSITVSQDTRLPLLTLPP